MEGEKVAVSGGDSGDEYGMEAEERPLRETFSFKLLFCPSGKIPTKTSGNIVYAITAIICKCKNDTRSSQMWVSKVEVTQN